jgi:hypothetical protein
MSSLLNNRTQEVAWIATGYFLDITTAIFNKVTEAMTM